jgi:hypothetical protein
MLYDARKKGSTSFRRWPKKEGRRRRERRSSPACLLASRLPPPPLDVNGKSSLFALSFFDAQFAPSRHSRSVPPRSGPRHASIRELWWLWRRERKGPGARKTRLILLCVFFLFRRRSPLLGRHSLSHTHTLFSTHLFQQQQTSMPSSSTS